MDIKTYLSEQRKKVEAFLRDYLDSLEGVPSELLEVMEYSLFAGGKRIRPILSLASCETVGGEQNAALAGGCAIEMIHTYSLIHDDLPCMDDDDLRRGKPASHVKFGEAAAVLAGDGLQSLAFEMVLSRVNDPLRACSIMGEIARAAGPAGMAGGQMLDMKYEGRLCTEEELELIHARKTGAILRASVMVGALSGDCSEKELHALSDYGTALGLLYQVVDDILDVEGDPNKLGKTTGKDAASEKSTFVKLRGLDGAKVYRDELHKKTVKALEIFSGRDTILSELSGFIISRDH